MKHKHHIVPKHAGGSDDSANIVELTPTQHAMWHFAEWQLHRRRQDELAWRGLAGYVLHEECIATAIKVGSENARKQREANNPNWHDKLQKAGTAAIQEKWKSDKAWADAQREHLRSLGKQHGYKGGKAGLNKRWWHNEETGQTTRSKTQPGPEWRLGKAPLSAESKLKHSQAQSGMLFWNNGKVSMRAKDCPGNEWVRGRLPHKAIRS